jgi:hypothetical protein
MYVPQMSGGQGINSTETGPQPLPAPKRVQRSHRSCPLPTLPDTNLPTTQKISRASNSTVLLLPLCLERSRLSATTNSTTFSNSIDDRSASRPPLWRPPSGVRHLHDCLPAHRVAASATSALVAYREELLLTLERRADEESDEGSTPPSSPPPVRRGRFDDEEEDSDVGVLAVSVATTPN